MIDGKKIVEHYQRMLDSLHPKIGPGDCDYCGRPFDTLYVTELMRVGEVWHPQTCLCAGCAIKDMEMEDDE